MTESDEEKERNQRQSRFQDTCLFDLTRTRKMQNRFTRFTKHNRSKDATVAGTFEFLPDLRDGLPLREIPRTGRSTAPPSGSHPFSEVRNSRSGILRSAAASACVRLRARDARLRGRPHARGNRPRDPRGHDTHRHRRGPDGNHVETSSAHLAPKRPSSGR